jgi:hypothetical protein
VANQNADDGKPIPFATQPGPGEHLIDEDKPLLNASNVSGNTTETPSNSTTQRNVQDAKAVAGKVSQSVKESSARVTDEAKQYASDMAGIAKEKSASMFEQKKEVAIGQAGSVAHALRSTADKLQEEGQGQVGHYINLAADQLESLSSQLRQKDLNTLINDTQNLARRSPGTFLASTVVAGFLLARFMKSSSERSRESAQMPRDEGRSAYMPEAEGSAGMPDRYGSMSGSLAGDSTAGGSDMSSFEDREGIDINSSPDSTLGTTATGAVSSNSTGLNSGGDSHGNR